MIPINKLLEAAIAKRASDLHITAGIVPRIRINGGLVPLDGASLTAEDTERLLYGIINDKQKELLGTQGHIDFSYEINGLSRFRINGYRQGGVISIAARAISDIIPPINELGIPSAAVDLARKERGLILVVGPAGNGKSTTQAAMLNIINEERAAKVVTLEDPVEYLHKHKRSIVDQRELHTDFFSFAEALTAALRQDPNVIMVGEMRDPETISTALTAALTGVLVIGTLHTGDCTQSISRIIDFFPPHHQQQIRGQLAQVLEGIIAQQLLPRLNGGGRILATEVLLGTPAVKNIIREGKIEQLINVFDTSTTPAIKSMNKHLAELTAKGLVDYEVAFQRAFSPPAFSRYLSHLGGNGK